MCFFIFSILSCIDIIFVMNNLVIWEDWLEKKIWVLGKCFGNNSNMQFKKLVDIYQYFIEGIWGEGGFRFVLRLKKVKK